MENKTSKYFKYAIGEIILVVIGILIALQINNWNENRKNSIAEKEFIEAIKNDLIKDKQFINLVLNQLDPKIEAFNILNKTAKRYHMNTTQSDSLLRIYLFNGQRTFYPISGSFQSAVAGNEINNFKNKKIIQSIIKYYTSTYTRVIDNGNILDNRWDNLSKKYSGERRKNAFEIKEDKDFLEILDNIYYHYIQLSWYKNYLNNVTIEIDELLKNLNN